MKIDPVIPCYIMKSQPVESSISFHLMIAKGQFLCTRSKMILDIRRFATEIKAREILRNYRLRREVYRKTLPLIGCRATIVSFLSSKVYQTADHLKLHIKSIESLLLPSIPTEIPRIQTIPLKKTSVPLVKISPPLTFVALLTSVKYAKEVVTPGRAYGARASVAAVRTFEEILPAYAEQESWFLWGGIAGLRISLRGDDCRPGGDRRTGRLGSS